MVIVCDRMVVVIALARHTWNSSLTHVHVHAQYAVCLVSVCVRVCVACVEPAMPRGLGGRAGGRVRRDVA